MNSKALPYIAIAVLIAILFFRECNREKEVITVTVPEQEGEFEPQEPIYIPSEPDTVYVTKWKTRTDTLEIETENPVNDSLAIAYQKAQDSLERYKLYLDAIQLRTFENVFEDEFLKLTISGEVQGELKYIKPTYKIKERDIEVEVPETHFRLLGGAEIGNNTTFSDFRYKLNVGLQNRKGDIYRLGYAKEGLQDYIWLGYDFSILNLKW